jgi:hypothetical protein
MDEVRFEEGGTVVHQHRAHIAPGRNGKLLSQFASLSEDEWLRRHYAMSEEDYAKDPIRNRLNVVHRPESFCDRIIAPCFTMGFLTGPRIDVDARSVADLARRAT